MGDPVFVFTNDDAGSQQPERFGELLDFLEEQQVPATFFVVPFGGGQPLDKKAEWRPLLDRALAAGHDLEHHAYDHSTCFEFGVPPGFMIDILSPEVQATYAQTPEVFTRHHGYDTLRRKLEEGREVLAGIFGYVPRGFRSPCLGVCSAQYQALSDLEFEFCSNEVINPLGWRYINREYETGEGWHEIPTHPYRQPSGVIEAPMHSEYTWYLEAGDVDRHFELARADLDRAIAAGDGFVTLSHYYAMTGEWAAGLEVYARLFAYARRRGVRFMTLRDYVAHSITDTRKL